jgi:hypothetical protein
LTVVKTAVFNDAGIIDTLMLMGKYSCRAINYINQKFPMSTNDIDVVIVEAIDDDKDNNQRYVAH